MLKNNYLWLCIQYVGHICIMVLMSLVMCNNDHALPHADRTRVTGPSASHI